MQLLTIILLVLNLIGVLFLTIRYKQQPKNNSGVEQTQKIVENQMVLYREMVEVKAKLENYYDAIQQESEQLKKDRQAVETALQALAKPKAKSRAKSKLKEEQTLLLNERYKEIFELQKQGLNAEEIAKKLDKGCGEVTLILDLAAQK